MPDDALPELVKLSDLVSIVGVGPVFVRLLYDVGLDTSEAFRSSSPDQLLEKVRAVEEGAALSVKDVEYCLRTARYLPQAIDYA